jgi:hypothetical protein
MMMDMVVDVEVEVDMTGIKLLTYIFLSLVPRLVFAQYKIGRNGIKSS